MVNKYKPLISIITPSFNQASYIEETILSVLNQTYQNLEYIIMDGGSTDGSLDIIKKYSKDPRLKWISRKDKGQYDAVNDGFLKAKGKILGWINSDDLYINDAVEMIVESFREYPDAEIIYGKYAMIKPDGAPCQEMKPIRSPSIKWLRRYQYINPSVTFIKSTIIHQDRIFIENSITNYGDWDWFLRLAKEGKKFYFLPEILGLFRIHKGSKISKMSRNTINHERRIISKRHNIPLSYMFIWRDIFIVLYQRFVNLRSLIKQKAWFKITQKLIKVKMNPSF